VGAKVGQNSLLIFCSTGPDFVCRRFQEINISPNSIAAEQQQKLLALARSALQNAYAPYSHFRVGAAVLTSRGGLYSGCNVENASYGLTVCAERSAIFTAVAAEGKGMQIQAVAVCTDGDGSCAPCGACRQVIFEFGPQATIFFQGKYGVEQASISSLLPHGFRLDTDS
jgi:cytidine deaminase